MKYLEGDYVEIKIPDQKTNGYIKQPITNTGAADGKILGYLVYTERGKLLAVSMDYLSLVPPDYKPPAKI